MLSVRTCVQEAFLGGGGSHVVRLIGVLRGVAYAGGAAARLHLRGGFGTSRPSTTGFVCRRPSRPARRRAALTAWAAASW